MPSIYSLYAPLVLWFRISADLYFKRPRGSGSACIPDPHVEVQIRIHKVKKAEILEVFLVHSVYKLFVYFEIGIKKNHKNIQTTCTVNIKVIFYLLNDYFFCTGINSFNN